jgi:uncharacterized membrane protein
VNTPSNTASAERAILAPEFREITFGDLVACLKSGLSDFAAFPAYGLFFGLFYAVLGMGIVGLALQQGYLVAVLPLIMGFALIGPFVAVGLYEVSRRREIGAPLSFPVVLGALRRQSGRQIMMLGFTLMVLLMFWVRVALLIYALFFGGQPSSPAMLAWQMMFNANTALFLFTGAVVGAGFAMVAFAISVLSFPHLLANDEDFISAILLSIRGTLRNLPVMILWGVIVGALLVLAAAPFFLGLALVLPILGHATWHLYRRVVT